MIRSFFEPYFSCTFDVYVLSLPLRHNSTSSSTTPNQREGGPLSGIFLSFGKNENINHRLLLIAHKIPPSGPISQRGVPELVEGEGEIVLLKNIRVKGIFLNTKNQVFWKYCA
ncbi:hypothetical protein BGP_5496 [Beggiatoa sp. PS]|nr:hypothetical protein BGP_5496 [Beggiatoa sp. PS]